MDRVDHYNRQYTIFGKVTGRGVCVSVVGGRGEVMKCCCCKSWCLGAAPIAVSV